MKKQLLFVFASLFFMAGSLQAQSVTLKAKIPFNFVVGSSVYHAGAYTFRPISLTGSAVLLQSTDLNDSVIITPCACASEATSQHESKLVFQVIDGRYFLWQIWTQGYQAGRELRIKHSWLEEAKLAPRRLVVIRAVVTKA